MQLGFEGHCDFRSGFRTGPWWGPGGDEDGKIYVFGFDGTP